jgi:hypothetical protein
MHKLTRPMSAVREVRELVLPAISRRSWPAGFSRISIIAAALKAQVIARVLTHPGLEAGAPPRSQADWSGCAGEVLGLVAAV